MHAAVTPFPSSPRSDCYPCALLMPGFDHHNEKSTVSSSVAGLLSRRRPLNALAVVLVYSSLPVRQRYLAGKNEKGNYVASRLVGLGCSVRCSRAGFAHRPKFSPLFFSAKPERNAFKTVGFRHVRCESSPSSYAWGGYCVGVLPVRCCFQVHYVPLGYIVKHKKARLRRLRFKD